MFLQRSGTFSQRILALQLRLCDQRGSAAVEYVGLALVLSSLCGSIAAAIDSQLSERLVSAVVDRLVNAVETPPSR